MQWVGQQLVLYLSCMYLHINDEITTLGRLRVLLLSLIFFQQYALRRYTKYIGANDTNRCLNIKRIANI